MYTNLLTQIYVFFLLNSNYTQLLQNIVPNSFIYFFFAIGIIVLSCVFVCEYVLFCSVCLA